MSVPEVDPVEAMRLTNESGAILLDVREDDEWSADSQRTRLLGRQRLRSDRSGCGSVPFRQAICRCGRSIGGRRHHGVQPGRRHAGVAR